jgi:hypothetical protein
MKTRKLMPLTAVSMALAVAGANAGDNPFQLVEYGEGMTVALESVDMQGNKVMINDETGFTYGGDGMAKYSAGKLATGTKDPAVCGSFAGASCSMPHLNPAAAVTQAATGAAADAAGKVMDKAMDAATDMMKKPQPAIPIFVNSQGTGKCLRSIPTCQHDP